MKILAAANTIIAFACAVALMGGRMAGYAFVVAILVLAFVL